MLKEAGKILNVIIEFCRDNLNMLMVAGVAIIVLILVISIVKSSKEDDDFDLDIDLDEFAEILKEIELKTMDLKAAEGAKETGIHLVDVLQPPKTACVEVFQDEPFNVEECEAEQPDEELYEEVAVEADGITVEKTEQEIVPKNEGIIQDADDRLPEQKKHTLVTTNTVSLGAIVEELAELSGEGVKKVEIKIPGAEVRITYVDEEKTLEDAPLKEKPLDVQKDKVTIEKPYLADDNDAKEDTAPAIKKFGPENMNTTRSGRIFSEEELQKQIRD